MGANGIIGLCSIMSAGFAGAILAITGFQYASSFMRKVNALNIRPEDRLSFLLQSLSKPFAPLGRKLAALSFCSAWHQASIHALGTKSARSPESFFSYLCCLTLFIVGISFALTLQPLFALAAGGTFLAIAYSYTVHKAHAHTLSMQEAVPDAMRLMADSFRIGYSLPQALSQMGNELDPGLGTLFQRCARRLEAGESTHNALAPLREQQSIRELGFVSVALDVQHQCGGSIAPLLESAQKSVESELELARTFRVQTAQAKLSASIVTVMPFILVALFSLISPGFLTPFFSSPLGAILLIVALSMQIAGVVAVRRICKADA